MSEASRAEEDEKRIIQRLKKAGWNLAEGADTLGTADLVYDNGHMVIEVSQELEKQELLLTLTASDGHEVTVYPVYGDQLGATLDAIVGFQDRIRPDNFHDMLRELVVACPKIYYQEGEDDEPRLLTNG